MGAEVVSFEERANELMRQGRRIGIAGPDPVPSEDGSVTIHAPVARGAALLVHKERTPEFDENLGYRCTKCRQGGADIVIVIGFPGGDGEPMQFCRTCLDRPVDKPLVIQFRA
jgi:hypothetical protein